MNLLEADDANQPLSSTAWTLAATIGMLLCFVQAGVMASLLAGRVGFAAVFPGAIGVSILAGYVLLRRAPVARRGQWMAAALFLLLLGASLALSAFFFDFSFDGQWYHQSAIIRIGQDWNPLTDPNHPLGRTVQLWDRHYAKGPWYFAAAVWATASHIEWGKSINWLALSACFFAVLGACLDVGLRRRPALGIALVTAINPVAVTEATTYMVDAVMISFLIVAAAAIFTSLHRPGAAVMVAGVAGAIITTNAKFTGLIYLCFVLLTGAAWCIVMRRRWFLKYAAVSLATLILAFCVWGYNPYLTNSYYRHQPFYPILGSAKYPSLEQQNQDGNELYETPKNMVGRRLPVRFFYAIFGRPGNQPYQIGKNATLMWPFTAVPADLYAYRFHEIRVAGFGPWFSGCLILALILGVWVIIGAPAWRWLLALMVLAVVASLSISRHLSWARFGPQLWLLPILPVAFAFRAGGSSRRLMMARVVLCLLMVNAALVAGVRLRWDANAAITLRNQMRQLRESGAEYEVQLNYFVDSTEMRLREAGVKFKDIGGSARSPAIPNSEELKSVVDGYQHAVRYRRVADSIGQ
jgi:4-amino-4-deoxy-L-arabinose transferase-like glycosyltransferase